MSCFGCPGCNQDTRFLCTSCNCCSNCCNCGGSCGDCGNGGGGGGGGGGGSFGFSNNNNLPTLTTVPTMTGTPAYQCCPSSVLTKFPSDPCCGCTPMPDISHPCPWPWYKRVYVPGCPVVPGYQGHVPGFKFHGAGRTYGDATRDTCCIMGQWGNCCPLLPCRVFEQ